MFANLVPAPHFARCGSVALNLSAVAYVADHGSHVAVHWTHDAPTLVLDGPEADAARRAFGPATAADAARLKSDPFAVAHGPGAAGDAICAWEKCRASAVTLACGRNCGHDTPARYCGEHADEVAREQSPEYIKDCPACGCHFGVG